MSYPTKPLIQAIRTLFKSNRLTSDMIDLAERSPTKFMRVADEELKKCNQDVQSFTFSSYGNICTLFIDVRWIPVINACSTSMYGFDKILAIKAVKSVAGYSGADAVPFDSTKNPCDIIQTLNHKNRNGAGLADAKCAVEGGIPGLSNGIPLKVC